MLLPRTRPLVVSVATAAFISTLALHMYLGSQTRYIADDFCSAAVAQRLGIFRAAWYWYLTWTGRFSASALDAVFGLMGTAAARVAPPLVLLSWLGAMASAIKSVMTRFKSVGIGSYTLAALLGYLTLLMSPSVPQALYWGQGMRSIFPAVILGTVHLDILARARGREPAGPRRWVSLLASFGIALAAGGFNETFAALQLAALMFAVVFAQRRPSLHAIQARLIAAALGAGVAVAVVVAAPGNQFRQAFYPPPPPLGDLLEIASSHFLGFVSGLASGPAVVVGVMGSASLGVVLGTSLKGTRPKRYDAALIACVGLLVAFVSFLPAAYALSDSPPDRTLLMTAHVLAVTIVLGAVSVGRSLVEAAEKTGRGAIVQVSLIAVAAGCCVASVILTDAAMIGSRDAFQTYAAHWDAANSQIIAARNAGLKQVWIQPIANWASLNEPNDNPKFWLNQCMTDYYGIQVLGRDIQSP